jgi:hypothetical protein
MANNFQIVTILLSLVIASPSIAQKEATNWYFGLNCGLEFGSREPSPVTDGKTIAVGGSAVISDRKTGELLFYTDGRNFWNREHDIMRHKYTLPSNCFARMTQPAIILPSTSDENLYHVFCIRPYPEDTPPSNQVDCVNGYVLEGLADNDSGTSLFYYLIDMRLNSGLGNVVDEKSNKLIQSNVTEKVTAVPHINGKDYWVVVHGWKSNRFYAHRLADADIVETVYSDIGSIHGDYGGIYFRDEAEGEMKLSPDGKKIATAVFSNNRPFDLFDFNPSTGIVNNYVNLGNVSGQYCVSFSPDNSKLYVSSDSRNTDNHFRDIILQYDLKSEPNDVAASRKSLIVHNPKTNLPPSGVMDGWSVVEKGMALALDGRLYISSNEPRDETADNDILVVIDKPNELGFDVDISFKRFAFGDGKAGVGLPNFMQSYFNGIESSTICSQSSALNIFPNPTSGIVEIDFKEGCSQTYSINVIDAIGKHIASIETIEEGLIDISFLPSGLYFFIVQLKKTKIVRKIVKL